MRLRRVSGARNLPELAAFVYLIQDSIRQAKADIRLVLRAEDAPRLVET